MAVLRKAPGRRGAVPEGWPEAVEEKADHLTGKVERSCCGSLHQGQIATDVPAVGLFIFLSIQIVGPITKVISMHPAG
jgi:hypothetical protein